MEASTSKAVDFNLCTYLGMEEEEDLPRKEQKRRQSSKKRQQATVAIIKEITDQVDFFEEKENNEPKEEPVLEPRDENMVPLRLPKSLLGKD